MDRFMTLAAHLPALQVVVPLLIAPIVACCGRADLAWAAATAASPWPSRSRSR
jgi:hypothetical protein